MDKIYFLWQTSRPIHPKIKFLTKHVTGACNHTLSTTGAIVTIYMCIHAQLLPVWMQPYSLKHWSHGYCVSMLNCYLYGCRGFFCQQIFLGFSPSRPASLSPPSRCRLGPERSQFGRQSQLAGLKDGRSTIMMS